MTKTLPKEIQEAIEEICQDFSCENVHPDRIINLILNHLWPYLHLPQSDAEQVDKIEPLLFNKWEWFNYTADVLWKINDLVIAVNHLLTKSKDD